MHRRQLARPQRARPRHARRHLFRHPVALAALAAAALITTGCEAGELPEEENGAADAPSGAVTEGEGEAAFAPVNRSGITGTVEADHDDENTTVTIALSGLEPGTIYPAHIHSGRCAAGGPVAVPLGRITARQDGTGRLTTRVAAADMGAGEAAFVQVHGPGGGAVACADLEGHEGGAQPLTERVAPDSVAGDGNGGGE